MNSFKKYSLTFLIILPVIIVILPIIILVLQGIGKNLKWPQVLPSNFSFNALKYVFIGNSTTLVATLNTILIAIGVILFDLILALPGAAALERYDFRGKTALKLMIFSPIVIPPFTAIMGMYMVFIKLGLTESLIGIILAHVIPTLPYMLKAIMISYSTLDPELEGQAGLLGAGTLNRFRYIILPHILPGIVTGASLTFLISISQYFLTLLVGGGKVLTLSIIMFPFINGGDKAIGSVFGILFSGIALINLLLIDFFLRKYYKKRYFKIL